MNINPNFLRFLTAFFIILFSCLFCNWPDFHPEDHVGMKYHWLLDMVFHGGYFFMATIVLLWLLSQRWNPWWICIALWLLSFLLEITQLWVPGRSFTLLDITSNTLGILFGFLIYRYGEELKNKKS